MVLLFSIDLPIARFPKACGTGGAGARPALGGERECRSAPCGRALLGLGEPSALIRFSRLHLSIVPETLEEHDEASSRARSSARSCSWHSQRYRRAEFRAGTGPAELLGRRA